MKQIFLNDQLILFSELQEKKIRLILYNNGAELACRKESVKNLQHFLALNDANIFKGRLRLIKRGDQIDVILKNETVGVISSSQLKEVL